MAKNKKQIYWIVGLIVVAVVLLNYINVEEEVSTGVDSKGVNLIVYGWRDGVRIGPLSVVYNSEVFSVVDIEPVGDPVTDIDAISIRHIITSSVIESTVDIDVSDLQATFTTDGNGDLSFGDDRYEMAIVGLSQSFTLIPGASQVEESAPFDITDLEDDCNDPPYCEIKLQAVASFQDVDPDTGLETTTNILSSESFGTIIVKVSSEKCSDGTPFGQCSLSAPGGQFCDGLTGLIDCADPTGCSPVNYVATNCLCDSGYYETDGDAVCSSPICNGGLSAGLCVGADALICDPGCTSETCGTIQNCYECGQIGQGQGNPLGWLDEISNAVECPSAYNGDSASSCHNTQHLCKYTIKAGKVDVGLIGI